MRIYNPIIFNFIEALIDVIPSQKLNNIKNHEKLLWLWRSSVCVKDRKSNFSIIYQMNYKIQTKNCPI